MSELIDILDENGNYLNVQEEREVAHQKGLWHRAVVVFLMNDKNQVLLQRRSATKKKWPNMLDVSAGGHSDAGEFGFETAIRETYEELGVKVEKEQLTFLGCTKSSFSKPEMTDNMFNEYYVAFSNVEASSIKLQMEEVSEVKYVTLEELRTMMNEGYKELTPKIEAYEFLLRYLQKVSE